MVSTNKLSQKFLDRLNQSKVKEMDKIYIGFFVKIVLSIWLVGAVVLGFYVAYSRLIYGSSSIVPLNFVFILVSLLIFFSAIMIIVCVKWYFNRRIPLARIFITLNSIGISIAVVVFNTIFREFTPFTLVNIHLFTTIMLVCLGILTSVVVVSFLSVPVNNKKMEPSLNVSFTSKVVPAFIFSILFFFMIVRGFSYKEGIEYSVTYENNSREVELKLITEQFGRLVSDIEEDVEMLSSLMGMARFADGGVYALYSRGYTEALQHYIEFVFSDRSMSGRFLENLTIHVTNPRAMFGAGYSQNATYVGLRYNRNNISSEPDIIVANTANINNNILNSIRNSRSAYVDVKYIDVQKSSFVVYVPMIVDDTFVGVAVFDMGDDTITQIIERIRFSDLDTTDSADIVFLSDSNELIYSYNETFENINEYLKQQRNSASWSGILSEGFFLSGHGINMSNILTLQEDRIQFNIQKSKPNNLNISVMSIWQVVMFKNRYNSVSFFEASTIISIIALIIYSIIVYFLIKKHQNRLLKLGYSTSVLAQNGGDLRIRMDVHSNDESSILAYGINRFLEKITSIINTLKDNISKMSVAFNDASALIVENYEMSDRAGKEFENEIQIIEKVSGLISNASVVSSSQRKQFVSVNDSIGTLLETVLNINSSMETQATAINETSASIHEMMSNISSVAQSAQKVNQFSKELVSDAKNGNDIGEDVMEAIQHIREASTQITDITRVIQLISEQTNLLAMNAAIEAAHAGEQGKGFAIVADKIRKLAEDTNENSKIISGIVQDVVDSVERTSTLAIQSSDAIEKILDSSQSVSSLIGEITNANSELDLGRMDILSVLKNLNQITFSVQNFSNEQTEISEKLNSQILSVDKLAVDVGYAVDSVNNETGELLRSIKSVSSLVLGSKEKIGSLESNMEGMKDVFKDINNLVNVFVTDKDAPQVDKLDSDTQK